jgi:ribosome-associated translation inhibitor RaiA
MPKHQPIENTRKQPLGVDARSVPRAKRGRTTAPQTPVDLHTQKVELPAPMVEYVHAKLGAKLGAFALQIDRVSVRFDDVNGPRGGVDCECRLQAILPGRPSVVAVERATSPRAAFDAATASLTRAVKRSLDRAGMSQGLSAAKRKSARRAPAAAPAAVEAEVEAEPAPTPAKASRKQSNYVPSAQKLGQRARAETNSGKSRATAAKARR